MAKKTIKAQMKQRRDTKANWAATNPVLLDGELGIVSDDPNLYKVGDGATAWNSLPFRGFDGTLAQELGTSPNAVISQKVVSDKLKELDSELKFPMKELDLYKTIYDSKLENTGSVTGNLARFNIYLFEVEPGKSYDIYNTILGTATSPSFSVYSSEELSPETAILIGAPISSHDEHIYITAPENAAYIAVQFYNSQYNVFEIGKFQDIAPDVVTLKKDTIGYGESIKPDSSVSGYIYYDGSIDPNVSFSSVIYPVLPNTQYWVYSALRSGVARMYAIYSSNELTAENVISIGIGVADTRDDAILITTPENAAFIAISTYKNSANAIYLSKTLVLREVEKEVQEIKETVAVSLSGSSQRTIATLNQDGENLYIAYLDETGTEYTYWFKKCMFNELYTFYRVGYRTVERNYPSTGDIESLTGVTLINSTGSDNIGPLLFKSGRWAGGNHSYNNDGVTKTAQTNSWHVYIDGVALKPGESRYANRVQIKVNNTIFDPAQLPAAEIAISQESVDYSICKNTIEVSVRQNFADTNNPVERYYGMQSMFNQDQLLLIPNGGLDNWVNTPEELFIEKEQFPKLNRFIEGNESAKAYQATYLIPNKDGNHGDVETTIFNRSFGKCYHYIIDHDTPVGGSKIVWSGTYTFFNTPTFDNENVLIYEGVLNGKDALFINAKKAFTGALDLPAKFLMKKITVVEKDETITTANEFIDSEGIELRATGTGSLIITLA